MNKPDRCKQLPGIYRLLQPHEKVKNGDYMQINLTYYRINDAHIIEYDCSGGPFGTYWTEVK